MIFNRTSSLSRAQARLIYNNAQFAVLPLRSSQFFSYVLLQKKKLVDFNCSRRSSPNIQFPVSWTRLTILSYSEPGSPHYLNRLEIFPYFSLHKLKSCSFPFREWIESVTQHSGLCSLGIIKYFMHRFWFRILSVDRIFRMKTRSWTRKTSRKKCG